MLNLKSTSASDHLSIIISISGETSPRYWVQAHAAASATQGQQWCSSLSVSQRLSLQIQTKKLIWIYFFEIFYNRNKISFFLHFPFQIPQVWDLIAAIKIIALISCGIKNWETPGKKLLTGQPPDLYVQKQLLWCGILLYWWGEIIAKLVHRNNSFQLWFALK